MDCFIKKIFDNNTDNLVHLQFQKFSRGEFDNKVVIISRRVKDVFSLATTSEFANEFVRMCAEKLGKTRTRITGILVSTRDLQGELNFKEKKQFMGIKQYVLDNEMSGEEIIALCDKFPTSFIALSFNIGETELKIKQKAPKSAKPSTKTEETPKADFCKLKTTDKALVKNILFDLDINNFKKVEIVHKFIIENIILPKEEKDIAKIREMAKRKGKIVRRINIDGKKELKEINFEA